MVYLYNATDLYIKLIELEMFVEEKCILKDF